MKPKRWGCKSVMRQVSPQSKIASPYMRGMSTQHYMSQKFTVQSKSIGLL